MTTEAQMREQFEPAFRRVYSTFCQMHAQMFPERDLRNQILYVESKQLWEEAIKAAHQSATEQMKPLVEAAKGAIQKAIEDLEWLLENNVESDTQREEVEGWIEEKRQALATIEQQEKKNG